jgi:DNA topoisomerase-1
MSHTLIIVESYTKCAKIETFLGDTYKCVACFGHFRELLGLKAIQKLPSLQFTIMENKKAVITKLKNAVKQAQEVILATDADREGEAIAWHLCTVLKLPLHTTKRMRFSEITESAINYALHHTTLLDMNMVHAQLARQVLDLMIGYKVSPVLWQNVQDGDGEGLSAGRCQTPALRLLYDQYQAKAAEVYTYTYAITGYFTSLNLPFVLTTSMKKDEDTVKGFLQESQTWSHVYSRDENIREHTVSNPLPFNTSRLIQRAYAELNLTPAETMKHCQTLYETGHITYLRTDSTHYSPEFVQDALKYIAQEYGSKKEAPKEAPREAHEAIRPTVIRNLEPLGLLNATDIQLYKLIRRNTLQSLLGPSVEKLQDHYMTAPQNLKYKFTTKHIVHEGWRLVETKTKTKTKTSTNTNTNTNTHSENTYLNCLKSNVVQPFKHITAKVQCMGTQTHYTDATLIHQLEEHGIGRSSTYASIVEKLFAKNYVSREKNINGTTVTCPEYDLFPFPEKLCCITAEREFGKETNKLVITNRGIAVMECLLLGGFEPLFQYSYTQRMEQSLDKIATNESDDADDSWITLCQTLLKDLKGIKKIIKEKEKEEDISFLGLHEGLPVHIKRGKFGLYLTWGERKFSKPNHLTITTLEEAMPLLQSTPSKLVREINAEASIRIGPHGDYLFYLNKKMMEMKKKPKFLPLTNIPADYKTCNVEILKDWFTATYKK